MKILVVDDSRFSQIVTSKLIKEKYANVEIIIGSDGQEGFELYKEIKPDYVLIDLLMPKVNGQEAIKLIKEYDEDAKIIVISADVQKSVKNELKEYGILSFINKPFDKEKLEIIANIIECDLK